MFDVSEYKRSGFIGNSIPISETASITWQLRPILNVKYQMLFFC